MMDFGSVFKSKLCKLMDLVGAPTQLISQLGQNFWVQGKFFPTNFPISILLDTL